MEVPKLYINQDYFSKSPLGSPSKILKALDLLAVEKDSTQNNISGSATEANSPYLQKSEKSNKKIAQKIKRRSSFTSDVVYHHTISDEFAHIDISIKECRRNSFGTKLNNMSNENSIEFNSVNKKHATGSFYGVYSQKVCAQVDPNPIILSDTKY
jgi:hypothetical protein